MKIHCIVPSKKYVSMETMLSKRREMISHQGYLQSYASLPVSQRFSLVFFIFEISPINDPPIIVGRSISDISKKQIYLIQQHLRPRMSKFNRIQKTSSSLPKTLTPPGSVQSRKPISLAFSGISTFSNVCVLLQCSYLQAHRTV